MTSYLDVLGADMFHEHDAATVRAVQQAIMALPQYKVDAKLSLAPYGADGKWGPVTAAAVERFNAYYRAGGAADNDGPHITDGTLAALKIGAGAFPAPPSPTVQTPGLVPSPTRQSAASEGVLASAVSAPLDLPPWKLAVAGGALALLGTGLYLAMR